MLGRIIEGLCPWYDPAVNVFGWRAVSSATAHIVLELQMSRRVGSKSVKISLNQGCKGHPIQQLAARNTSLYAVDVVAAQLFGSNPRYMGSREAIDPRSGPGEKDTAYCVDLTEQIVAYQGPK